MRELTLGEKRYLPMRVAPKKVQKGMRKCPHVMPARSNRGLGMLAQARIPKKPTFSTSCWTEYFILSNLVSLSGCLSFSCSSWNSSSSSLGSEPESLAALAMK